MTEHKDRKELIVKHVSINIHKTFMGVQIMQLSKSMNPMQPKSKVQL